MEVDYEQAEGVRTVRRGDDRPAPANLAAFLRTWATSAEQTEDAETNEDAVFVPRCISGEFHDALHAAAKIIERLPARPSATGSNLADKLAALAYKWEEQTRSARLLEATLINKHARELRALLADQPARSYDFSLIARMLRSYSGTTTAYANGDAVEAYALARQLPDAQPAPVVGVTDWTVRLAQDSLSADLAGEGIPLPTYEVMQLITRRALLSARPGGEAK